MILIDDGLATGSTMRAAVGVLRQEGPERIVVAVPAASPETCAEFEGEVDEVVCATTPDPFYAVALRYEDFLETSDHEVRAPTWLIVVGEDRPVLAMNRAALTQLPGEKKLVIVPGATRLFEELGALEEVARLARD